jgi:hypothetical protein
VAARFLDRAAKGMPLCEVCKHILDVRPVKKIMKRLYKQSSAAGNTVICIYLEKKQREKTRSFDNQEEGFQLQDAGLVHNCGDQCPC